MSKPRILIPEPTSTDPEYNQRGWPQYAAAVEQAGGIPALGAEIPLHAFIERLAHAHPGFHDAFAVNLCEVVVGHQEMHLVRVIALQACGLVKHLP